MTLRPHVRVAATAFALCAALIAGPASAQDDTTTPLGLAPGAPSGSYPLSGFERINHFNGAFSFYLPLLNVGGRGEASHVVGVLVERRWGVVQTSPTDQRLVPRFDWWRGFKPGFGPGVLRSYHDKDNPGGGTNFFHLTRYTFSGPDGTQQELRDVLTEGEPQLFPESRGRIFHTSDGTAMTFYKAEPPPGPGVNGMLLFRDGRHYRIDDGHVTWIRDRNGNKLEFQYTADPEKQVSRIVDAAGRVYEFVYEGANGPAMVERIRFKGFGGAPREIRVEHGTLATALVPGQSVSTLEELFPELLWLIPTQPQNPDVVRRIVLPNGQSYELRYNAYAELAQVTLPTGGVIRYTHGPGVAGGPPGGEFGDVIYRRIREKTTATTATGPIQTKSRYGTEVWLGADEYVDEERLDPSNGDALISRVRHYFHGHASDELTPPHNYYPHWRTGREYRTEVYSTPTTLLRAATHTWAQRLPLPAWSGTIPNDARIVQTRTTLDNGLVSAQRYAYDEYNNRTETVETAFGPVAPGPDVRKTQTDFLTWNGAFNYATDLTIHIRDLPLQQRVYSVGPGGSTERARTTFEYDNYVIDANHAELVLRGDIFGLDTGYLSTSKVTRGNRTKTERWLDFPAGVVSTYQQYDVAGSVVRLKDARGNLTVLGFEDSYGPPDGNARDNMPPPELGDKVSYAHASWVKDPMERQAYTQFDYHLGALVDHEDVNGVVSSAFRDDALDRPTELVRAQGRPEKARTRFEYQDAGPNPSVDTYSDQETFDDGVLRTTVLYDALGREVGRRAYETDTAFIVSSAMTYDGAGRVKDAFVPFRPGDTSYRTTTTYDALDRPTAVTAPGNMTTITSFTGNVARVTDPAQKARESVSDALGRVTSVTEDPGSPPHLNQTTTYAHDVFDNVVQVTQGSQQRTFAYDSLSRLICASMPEGRVGGTQCTSPPPAAGVARYKYDPSGNLLQREDAGGVTANHVYDILGRKKSSTYNDGTPAVAFNYDDSAVPFSKGRLTSVESAPSTTRYVQYDSVGRVRSSRQEVPGVAYPLSYTYDLAGHLRTETYPSGRVITTAYDAAGRLKAVSQGSTEYARVADPATDGHHGYAPHGGLEKMKLGNGLWQQGRYNCRLQQWLAGLGGTISGSDVLGVHLNYGTDGTCVSTVANNGNVLSETIVTPTRTFSQSFLYDGANRLKTASESFPGAATWDQIYEYDRWGNRAVTSTVLLSCLSPPGTNHFDPATNRILSSVYDDAGNQTRDCLGRTFTYDAENRQTAAGTTTYAYDGFGRRVRKTVDGASTTYVYDAMGRLVAEYGGLNLGTAYFTPDHLGSTRIVTDNRAQVRGRMDYLPFGQLIPVGIGRTGLPGYGSDGGARHKFTGKERDLETDLDFFGARYFSSPQGRFTGADAAAADPLAPQTWNRYAYSRNNPLGRIDPDGNSDIPAQSERINQALASDPALLEVIKASNNFSQRGFEWALMTGGLKDLNKGAGNILRGLAGEAVTLDSLRTTMLSRTLVVPQPPIVDDIVPDLVQVFPTGRFHTPFATVAAGFRTPMVLTSAAGSVGTIEHDPSIHAAMWEVKSGVSASGIPKGVAQVERAAVAMTAAGIPGAAFLVVDPGAWGKLSRVRQAEFFQRLRSVGAYIQLYPGLAQQAERRAKALIDEARR
jgi:RHS repeat-associated protein